MDQDNIGKEEKQQDPKLIKNQSHVQDNSFLSTMSCPSETQQQFLIPQIDDMQKLYSSEQSKIPELDKKQSSNEEFDLKLGSESQQSKEINEFQDKVKENISRQEEEIKQNGDNENEIISLNKQHTQSSQKEQDVPEIKIYLYQQILHHHLWQSRDFWESAIFDSSFEGLKSSSDMRKGEQIKESQLRERNICFGQLVSILQNMLLFEIDKREIRYLLLKFAKLFYLTDDQIKSLNNTVDQHQYSSHNNPNYFQN